MASNRKAALNSSKKGPTSQVIGNCCANAVNSQGPNLPNDFQLLVVVAACQYWNDNSGSFSLWLVFDSIVVLPLLAVAVAVAVAVVAAVAIFAIVSLQVGLKNGDLS